MKDWVFGCFVVLFFVSIYFCLFSCWTLFLKYFFPLLPIGYWAKFTQYSVPLPNTVWSAAIYWRMCKVSINFGYLCLYTMLQLNLSLSQLSLSHSHSLSLTQSLGCLSLLRALFSLSLSWACKMYLKVHLYQSWSIYYRRGKNTTTKYKIWLFYVNKEKCK